MTTTTHLADHPRQAAASGATAPPPRSWPRRIGRRTTRVLTALLVLALIGAALQGIAERRDAAAHPAPGEHLELPDGRRLHLQVAGEHHDGLTVIFEAGAGAHSDQWAWIQPAVAEHATALSYDRAGLGWSDRSDHGPVADAIVNDLRNALVARGLPGPYVLVGHSLGAHYVRAFADAHREEVAGVVLVDPSHEHQSVITGSHDDMGMVHAAFRVAARLGLLRLHNPMVADVYALPEPQRSRALSHLASTPAVQALVSEMRAVDDIGAQLPSRPGALGDIALRVLIATEAAGTREQEVVAELAELKAQLPALSTQGEAVVLPQANHYTIVTDRQHAVAVSDTIRDVLRTAAG